MIDCGQMTASCIAPSATDVAWCSILRLIKWIGLPSIAFIAGYILGRLSKEKKRADKRGGKK